MIDALEVRTPEGVPFRLPLAGPAARGMALVLDLVAVLAAEAMLGWVGSAFLRLAPDAVGGVLALGYYIVWTGYGAALEILWHGQTVGKRVMGLRVMDVRAQPARASQLLLRNLLRPLDAMPALYLVGVAVCWVTRYRQRLGDLAAGTVVVRTAAPGVAEWSRLRREKYNSLAEHGALAARLRQRTPAELAGLALDAVLRREELSVEGRTAIFGELAGRLRAIVVFPAEAVETLSDEQYVRRAVEVLYSTGK